MTSAWFCRIAGTQYGPLTAQQLQAMAAAGQLQPQNEVGQSPQGPWGPAGQVPGLFPAAPAQAPAQPAHAPAQPAAPRPAPARPVQAAPVAGQAPLPQAAPLAQPAQAVAQPAMAQPAPSQPAGESRASDASAAMYDRRRAKQQQNMIAVVVLGVLTVVVGLGAAVLLTVENSRDPGDEPSASGPSSPQGPVVAPALSPEKPQEPERWVDAGGGAKAQCGDFSIGVVEAKIGSPRLIKPDGKETYPKSKFVQLTVELKNGSTGKPERYLGWSLKERPNRHLRLTDERGAEYESKSNAAFHGAAPEGQLTQGASVAPGETIRDVLLFKVPDGADPQRLRLTLPGAALGNLLVVGFEIPKSMIEAIPPRESPKRPQPGDGLFDEPAPNNDDLFGPEDPVTEPEPEPEKEPENDDPVYDGPELDEFDRAREAEARGALDPKARAVESEDKGSIF